MANSPGGPFKISCPAVELARLRRWADRATDLGLGEEFTEAVRAMNTNLKTRPLTWGDPLYHLHFARLLVMRALQQMLFVEYGVHEERRIVFIKQFKLVPGSPLEAPE